MTKINLIKKLTIVQDAISLSRDSKYAIMQKYMKIIKEGEMNDENFR
ncbi:hypothetical protein [Clostridium cellulovorans]|nr:hypothetical protein [Clostridium cellulovorans]